MTRPTPHGASRLVQTMFAWSVKNGCAPSRHCRGAKVYGHTTSAMHDNTYTSPPLNLDCFAGPIPMFVRVYSGPREKVWQYEAWRIYRKQCFCKGATRPQSKPCRRTFPTYPDRKCRRTLSGAPPRLLELQEAIKTMLWTEPGQTSWASLEKCSIIQYIHIAQSEKPRCLFHPTTRFVS